MLARLSLGLVGGALSGARAFYLPGVAPRDYQVGESVEIKVNKLDSIKTQLPYDYYSLPFCRPEVITESAENLGEVLSGDLIESSLYEANMKIIESCKVLCKQTYGKEELAQFSERIQEDYRVNWIVDNIPAATKYFVEVMEGDDDDDEKEAQKTGGFATRYEKGFALGFMGGPSLPNTKEGVAYINNHLRLFIFYHEEAASGFRIVGFEVEPFSVKHKLDGGWKGADTKLSTCTPLQKIDSSATPQPVNGDSQEIIFTYDVQWEASEIKWASRWDLYLKMTDSQIHWFSISNSVIVVLFLSAMVAMIMLRTLRSDLQRYNELDLTEEEKQEETGWKLIHGEVFRPPRYGSLFAVLVGTGTQVFAMTVLTLLFAMLGFLSPANRGGLMTALLLLFVFMGMLAGYFSTRVYKMFKLTEWKRNTLWTAMFFPGVMFSGFFILNLFVWGKASSGAVPFATLVALLVLWLGISVPLVYLGSYLAFKKPAIEPPLRVNNIPRMLLPDRPWYTHPALTIMAGGVLPFGACFIEIFFLMTSVWKNSFYYVFGCLFIVFVVLCITCAEITIVLIYFQLCNEDYHWWWRSYLTSGSSAAYLLAYSVMYFFTQLEITSFVSGLLFFGYMCLVSFAFFILTGTIGYFACFFFVRKIYSSIKID